MKKLTMITNTLTTFGGGEKWSLEVATRLKNDFEITIANPVAGRSLERMSMANIRHEYDLKGIKIVDLKARSVESSSFGSDKYLMILPKIDGIQRLTNVIKNSDVIYMISFNPFLLSLVVSLCKVYRKKLILGIHNPTFSKLFDKEQGIKQKGMNTVFLSLLRRIKHFHVLNQSDLKLVKIHFRRSRATLIPVFITQSVKSIRANKREFIALFVGRLETSQKGIDLLYHVIEKVLTQNSKIAFHIIGKGGDGEQTVSRLENRHPLNVKWLGFVSDAKLADEFRNSSISISTSRYETFPAVLQEAQVFGLPVVAFDVEGPRTIVVGKEHGTLIKGFDTGEFAARILGYYEAWESDKEKYQERMQEISTAMNKRYESQKIIPELRKMMDSA